MTDQEALYEMIVNGNNVRVRTWEAGRFLWWAGDCVADQNNIRQFGWPLQFRIGRDWEVIHTHPMDALEALQQMVAGNKVMSDDGNIWSMKNASSPVCDKNGRKIDQSLFKSMMTGVIFTFPIKE